MSELARSQLHGRADGAEACWASGPEREMKGARPADASTTVHIERTGGGRLGKDPCDTSVGGERRWGQPQIRSGGDLERRGGGTEGIVEMQQDSPKSHIAPSPPPSPDRGTPEMRTEGKMK